MPTIAPSRLLMSRLPEASAMALGSLCTSAAASEVVIVSAARTPIGSFNGALSTVAAPELGTARAYAGAVAANGTVLVCGGHDDEGTIRVCEECDALARACIGLGPV